MIHPHHPLKHAWDLVVLLLVLVAALDIPLRVTLSQEPTGGRLLLDWITTAVFLVDVVLSFRTARFIRGTLVRSRGPVARDYLRSTFGLDLVSALPLHLFLPGPWKLVRLARLLAFPAFFRYFRERQASRFIHPIAVRLLFFGCGVLVLAHWVACGGLVLDIDPSRSSYIDALYWSVTTLTTVGYGDITPTTSAGKIYTMFVMCLGVGIYAYVIGTIATMIAEADFARSQHQDELDQVNAFVNHHRLPTDLQDRIRGYYDYLWDTRRGLETGLRDLPPPLRTDVALYVLRDVIRRVPMFEKASPLLLRTLVIRLQPQIYGPGDMIIRSGEIADGMYFVSRGRAEVTASDSKTVAELVAGDHFGEMALLSSSTRTANVQAQEYCDVFFLSRVDFDDLVAHFDDFAAVVRSIADERGQKAD